MTLPGHTVSRYMEALTKEKGNFRDAMNWLADVDDEDDEFEQRCKELPTSITKKRKRHSVNDPGSADATTSEYTDDNSEDEVMADARYDGNERNVRSRRSYTEDEDARLIQLKEVDQLSWEEITNKFPVRSYSSLRSHYNGVLRSGLKSRRSSLRLKRNTSGGVEPDVLTKDTNEDATSAAAGSRTDSLMKDALRRELSPPYKIRTTRQQSNQTPVNHTRGSGSEMSADARQTLIRCCLDEQKYYGKQSFWDRLSKRFRDYGGNHDVPLDKILFSELDLWRSQRGGDQDRLRRQGYYHDLMGRWAAVVDGHVERPDITPLKRTATTVLDGHGESSTRPLLGLTAPTLVDGHVEPLTGTPLTRTAITVIDLRDSSEGEENAGRTTSGEGIVVGALHTRDLPAKSLLNADRRDAVNDEEHAIAMQSLASDRAPARSSQEATQPQEQRSSEYQHQHTVVDVRDANEGRIVPVPDQLRDHKSRLQRLEDKMDRVLGMTEQITTVLGIPGASR